MVASSVDLWLVGFARALPVVALHPIFGGSATPRIVKVAVAAALASVAAPTEAAPLASTLELAVSVGWALASGAAVGVVGQAVFGTIEAAGRLVDDARGANVARLFAPQLDAAASPLGQLELSAAIAVYWGAGLHAGLVVALAAPPIATSVEGHGLEAVCLAAGALARAGLAIAGPAVLACVVVDLLMAVVNRASPASSVFSLGLPLKLGAAVLVTAAGLPGRGTAWAELWARHDAWLRAAASLGGP